MKLPKAEKRSGKWRMQIQVNGKRHSITKPTKKECEEEAKRIFAGMEMEKKSVLTVGKAIDQYILEKTGTLSPSTIQGYKVIRRNYLQSIMDVNLTELIQSDVQMAVSSDRVEGKSPKTIRNAHGLLAATLDEFRPDFTLRTRLPQKEAQKVRIPTEEEIQKIWSAAKGDKYEIPILMGSWLGLRMSEVRGAKFSDIVDGRIHIQRALVDGENGPVEKGTKSASGDRWIKVPDVLLEKIKMEKESRGAETDDRICPYNEPMILRGFVKICEKAGVEPCRFHDLRHFAASEAHALGVPDKYAMKRMGHKTDNMLKTVYQHTMSDKEEEFNDRIDERLNELYLSVSDKKT